jgi:hypothetical protein
VEENGFSPVPALTLNLLTTTIIALPSNVSKWQMGFNSAFKELSCFIVILKCCFILIHTHFSFFLFFPSFFHSCTVQPDAIKVFYLPTDAQ